MSHQNQQIVVWRKQGILCKTWNVRLKYSDVRYIELCANRNWTCSSPGQKLRPNFSTRLHSERYGAYNCRASIGTFENTIILFVCPGNVCISNVLVFSWDNCKCQEKLETMLMKNWRMRSPNVDQCCQEFMQYLIGEKHYYFEYITKQ